MESIAHRIRDSVGGSNPSLPTTGLRGKYLSFEGMPTTGLRVKCLSFEGKMPAIPNEKLGDGRPKVYLWFGSYLQHISCQKQICSEICQEHDFQWN